MTMTRRGFLGSILTAHSDGHIMVLHPADYADLKGPQ